MPPQAWKDFEVEGIKFTEEDVNSIYISALLIRGKDRPDMNRSIPNPHGTVYTYTAGQIKGLVGEILKEKGKTAADLADSATWRSWDPKSRVSDLRDPRKPTTQMLNERVGSNIDEYLRRSSTLYERSNPGQAARSGALNPGLKPPALGSFQHWQSGADRPPGPSIQGMTADMEAASLTQTARSSKRAIQPKESRLPPDLTPALPSSWDSSPYLQPPAQPQYRSYAEKHLSHPSGSHQSSYGVPQRSYPQWQASDYGVPQSSDRGITAAMNAASLTPTAGSSMQASHDEPPAQSKGFAIGGKILPKSEEGVAYACAIDKGVGDEYTYNYQDMRGVITEMFIEDQQAEYANSDAWARCRVDNRVREWRDPDNHRTQILRERVRHVKNQSLERGSKLYRRYILVHPEMARGRLTSSKQKRRSEQERAEESSVPGVPANMTSILQTPERSRNEEEERARKRPAEGGNGQGAGGSRDAKAPRRKDGNSGRGR